MKIKIFFADLIRNNVCDVIKADEVESLIEEGIIITADDVNGVQDDLVDFCIHRCGPRCLVPGGKGGMRCKAKNFQQSKENTRHCFVDLPNNFSTVS